MTREKNQSRHEQLIDFLNKFDQYGGKLKKVKSERSSDKFQHLDTYEINQAVEVMTDVLNLGGGSLSDIDLYELLQAYLQVPDYRERFNNLVSEAKIYSYRNNPA